MLIQSVIGLHCYRLIDVPLVADPEVETPNELNIKYETNA